VETAASTGQRCGQWARVGSDLQVCAGHTSAVEPPRRRAVTAAVASLQMDGVGWRTWKFGSRQWQAEAWRLYDITGQLRFVANWVGNSVSRCRLFVAEVDDNGDAAAEAEDERVAALAATPLGSGSAKDESLRLLGINLFVAGEAYIVAEAGGADGDDDRWFVVSGKQIRRQGDRILIKKSDLFGGGQMEFRPGEDLLLRVWTPHPADTDEPDSPTRSAIPDLRKIEAIRKRTFAELDSRLAGAGLLPLPEGIDFPASDDDPPGMEGLQARLMRAMSTSLQDRSSAAAMVPIMFTVPGEFLDKIRQVTFWSELSAQLLPMEESAIRSLAQSLDVPPEVLLGLGESNHWNAWASSEQAISIQIMPLLARIADALATGYLQGALDEVGADPDRYTYAFDPAPLAARPNRTADALNYHGALLLSDEAAVTAGAFVAENLPTPQERLRRLMERAVTSTPSLLADPAVAQILGVPAITAPPAEDGGGGGQPPARVRDDRALPEQTPQTEEQAALVAVSSLAVLRALGLAGGRLVPHRQRDRWPGTARHDLHAQVGPVEREQAEVVLRGAWDDLDLVAAQDLRVDPAQLRLLLHEFCAELLIRGMAYEPRLLRDLLAAAVRTRRLAAPEAVAA
jgi:hypothetical protein